MDADCAELEDTNKRMADTIDRLDEAITAKLDAHDALAESHADLLAALEWALPYAQDAKLSLDQAARDEHAKGLYEAKVLIRKARAL